MFWPAHATADRVGEADLDLFTAIDDALGDALGRARNRAT